MELLIDPEMFLSDEIIRLPLEEVKKHKAPWEDCYQIGLITVEEKEKLDAVKEVDEISLETIEMIIKILEKTENRIVIKYIIAIFYELWKKSPKKFATFSNSNSGKIFFQKLGDFTSTENSFLGMAALEIQTFIYSELKDSCEPDDLFNKYIRDLENLFLYNSDFGIVSIGCQLLTFLYQKRSGVLEGYKIFIGQIPNILSILRNLLIREDMPQQLVYEILLFYWTISFNEHFTNILVELNLVPAIMEVIKGALKEKIIRIGIGIFKHMLEKSSKATSIMIGHRVLDLANNLMEKNYGDEDLNENLKWISDFLENVYQSLNNYEEYLSEISTGNLYWSPPHKSETFWKNNASKMTAKDGQIPKILISLAGNEYTEPQAQAIAAHDLGQISKYCPDGHKIIEKLGGKSVMVRLFRSSDPSVRFEALLAFQKYMSSRW